MGSKGIFANFFVKGLYINPLRESSPKAIIKGRALKI